MIQFYQSSVNMGALLVILTSIQSQFQGLDISKMTVQSWIVFALGILIIIFRTFLTNQPIGTPKQVKMWKLSKSNPVNKSL